jgi:integrase
VTFSLTICPLDCTAVVREAVRTASPPRSHAAIATCHDGDFAFQALQGDLLLGEIDADAIMDMKGKLQGTAGAKASGKEGSGKALSPRSIAKILTRGGTVWRYGRRITLVDGNPFADVKKPRAAKRVPYILDVEEIGRLPAALNVPFERLLVELTITTGLRSGEVRGLTWESIDLEGKRLFVERQASRCPRTSFRS